MDGFNPLAGPLAEALEENARLKRQLEQSARSGEDLLRQFVYAASHDLQEPLRTVLSYAQLLQRQLAGDPPSQELISVIIDAVDRMRALLQNLLAYSRVGGSTGRSDVNLNACLQWALLKLAPAIEESGAIIARGDLPKVRADETEIAQVFENLLGNALKFRPSEPTQTDRVQIRISVEEGSAEWIISVQDNGGGIDPRFLEQVLLPFKRLHGKQVPGSGLGLAICDKIIRAHGGRIWLESDGQRGTTARFTLPA